ncbi:hypothetical protein [Nonomuraea guangzhouensis]|uniref:Phage tail protein n=1 Tax=Nonomuraea guangzhouensis TaxID=1291555 RepID=A0ABW4GW53_9ACTN|nr:hypothetical protein [Nonomuraea guangzhouensis]
MAAQRGVYTVTFQAATIAAASGDYDFFELDAAAGKPIEIVALKLGNKSEIGDAAEEMVEYAIVRGNTTTGNGTSTTPRPLDASDGAASFTAKTVSSTPASAGTALTLVADTFNIRAGLPEVYPEIMRPKTAEADLLCVRLITALADDATMSGTVWVREL